LADIISIATALPPYCHKQNDILHFLQRAYNLDDLEKRKLSFLYQRSGIDYRYSVLNDFSTQNGDPVFINNGSSKDSISLDQRMKLYDEYAPLLSVKAIEQCIDGRIDSSEITHLITVSCTGMSAPGLDLQVTEAMGLSTNIFRTSVNFMGCYAVIHAFKIAKMICDSTANANVIIAATELSSLHFQKEFTADNAASSLLFSDGSAAALVSNCIENTGALSLNEFFSEVAFNGINDMSWKLSSKGFLMKLSGDVPELIQQEIDKLMDSALQKADIKKEEITHWCIHPGGRKILDVIQQKLGLAEDDMKYSRSVLSSYGNMSSVTILFVLKEIMNSLNSKASKVFGVAFGPGLTMETFIASGK
jgi:predicted naringenin-chalcone synthase